MAYPPQLASHTQAILVDSGPYQCLYSDLTTATRISSPFEGDGTLANEYAAVSSVTFCYTDVTPEATTLSRVAPLTLAAPLATAATRNGNGNSDKPDTCGPNAVFYEKGDNSSQQGSWQEDCPAGTIECKFDTPGNINIVTFTCTAADSSIRVNVGTPASIPWSSTTIGNDIAHNYVLYEVFVKAATYQCAFTNPFLGQVPSKNLNGPYAATANKYPGISNIRFCYLKENNTSPSPSLSPGGGIDSDPHLKGFKGA